MGKEMSTEIADASRVLEWMRDPNRKPAQLAFTHGPERQAAYWIEIAQDRIVELENVRAGLIAALSGLLDVVQSNYVPNSGHAQDQARAALDAAQPKAP